MQGSQKTIRTKSLEFHSQTAAEFLQTHATCLEDQGFLRWMVSVGEITCRCTSNLRTAEWVHLTTRNKKIEAHRVPQGSWCE